MTTIDHIHSSGRYDRSASSLKRATERYAKDATLITFTETERPGRKAALRSIDGFKLVTGYVNNRNDCSILYRNDLYDLIHSEQHKLSDARLNLGGKRTPPSYATYAILKVRANGLRFVVGVYHAPSSVEDRLDHKSRTSIRERAWRKNVPAFRTRANELRKKYNAQGEMLSADWNVNFKRFFVRRLFNTIYPTWRLNWRGHKMPHAGTIGPRIIDATFVRGKMKVLRVALYNDDPSSDHRPYWERLQLSI